MSVLRDYIINDLTNKMDAVASWICDDMITHLMNPPVYRKNNNVDTGALLHSIRHEIETGPDSVTVYIKADAKNPNNGAEYAEFIELGTGAAHGRPGGRVGSWRYQDRHGQWHTTDGLEASPFIEPAVEEHMDDIKKLADEVVFDLEKYWRLKGGERS